jgi:hypothetical protein
MNLDTAHMLALSEQKAQHSGVWTKCGGQCYHSHKSKGLKRVARVVSHLRSLGQHDIVKFYKVAGEDQLADGMSKQLNSQCATPSCWPGSTGGTDSVRRLHV